MLELHTHSNCSDGALSPRALVEASVKAGLKALALTDHDTMAGLPEAQATADRLGLELIPGVELSTTHQGYALHVLGFYPDSAQIQDALLTLQRGRLDRATQIHSKLHALGLKIALPNVANPGRPHFAQALVAAGYVPHAQAAFERYLREDGPAFVPYAQWTAVEAVALLRRCGAVPVWAHPLLFKGGPTERVLAELVAAGLQGLEVYRPDTSHSQRTRLLQLAKTYGLVVTGGSDFHGTEPSAIRLNMLKLPLTLLDALKQRSLGNYALK